MITVMIINILNFIIIVNINDTTMEMVWMVCYSCLLAEVHHPLVLLHLDSPSLLCVSCS